MKIIRYLFLVLLIQLGLYSFGQNIASKLDSFPKNLVISNTGDEVNWCQLYPTPEVNLNLEYTNTLEIFAEPYKIVDKGKGATISGITDYWYQVIFDNNGELVNEWAFGGNISLLLPLLEDNISDYAGIYSTSDRYPFSNMLILEVNTKSISLYPFFGTMSEAEIVGEDGKIVSDISALQKINNAKITGNELTSDSINGWFAKTEIKNNNQKIIKGLLIGTSFYRKIK